VSDDAGGSHTDLEELGAPIPAARPIARGTVLAGRFVVEKLLGRGGMGVVVRAHDRVLGEPVAIKILRPELAAERRWVDRLAREVKLARQIRHPNVCRVFEFGEADGHVFLVMELATGGSLRAELDAGILQARPVADRLADARAITAGLAAIHDAGIVHRDVTPSNILRMSDGRPVVSDFGLATDASETTTSIHGGTVAYMAPEVVRGEKATFASDVWSLGVLIHEVVFGSRPQWSPRPESPMATPPHAGTTESDERKLFDLCLYCTSVVRTRRPASAVEVLASWNCAGHPSTSRRVLKGLGVLCIALSIAVGLFSRVIVRNTHTQASSAAQLDELMLIGQAADWTDRATVLTTIEGRIHCVTALPGHRTLRFLWGTPPKLEDIDVVTRARRPSPLIAVTYANGCPDLSPDGSKLIYQGHERDGRPVIYLSESADGSGALPVVESAEPSVSSEPRWLPDGRAFIFDVDAQHAGVFATETKRTTILPEVTHGATRSLFRFVSSNRIAVVNIDPSGHSEIGQFEWPSLQQTAHLRLPWFVSSWYSSDRKHAYLSDNSRVDGPIIDLDLHETTARRVGFIFGQRTRHFEATTDGLAFVSWKDDSDIWVKDATGALNQLTNDRSITAVRPCGDNGFIAERVFENERVRVIRVMRNGHETDPVSPGPRDGSPACIGSGEAWVYTSYDGARPVLHRCDEHRCVAVAEGDLFAGAVASPNGERIAYITISNRGPHVRWISVRGGDAHEVADTETLCAPGWSSDHHLWVSRRLGDRVVWMEVDADTTRKTGATVEGKKDCTDGLPDPASPVDPAVRLVVTRRSQIRLLRKAADLVAPNL
jgi:serine/threonine protein kinase